MSLLGTPRHHHAHRSSADGRCRHARSLQRRVSNAGGLGSIGVGATDAAGAQAMIDGVRALTSRAFNVNVLHARDARPGSGAGGGLAGSARACLPAVRRRHPRRPWGRSTRALSMTQAMAAMLTAAAVPVVSFHFGLPSAELIASLKGAGCILFATATHLHEALAAECGRDRCRRGAGMGSGRPPRGFRSRRHGRQARDDGADAPAGRPLRSAGHRRRGYHGRARCSRGARPRRHGGATWNGVRSPARRVAPTRPTARPCTGRAHSTR